MQVSNLFVWMKSQRCYFSCLRKYINWYTIQSGGRERVFFPFFTCVCAYGNRLDVDEWGKILTKKELNKKKQKNLYICILWNINNKCNDCFRRHQRTVATRVKHKLCFASSILLSNGYGRNRFILRALEFNFNKQLQVLFSCCSFPHWSRLFFCCFSCLIWWM